ncbi:MAG: MlaD family protein [Candidatus Omnitrophota bacterium]|jgi:phospholipid/cholesterol/gamma-HCH transport system substrate-binding protein
MNNNSTTSSEIRSGLLVLVSILVCLGLLFMSGGLKMMKDNYEVPLTFKYISGLQKNAPVHVAGYQVGKVTDIRFLGPGESGVLVTASVSKDVVLKKDAEAYINVAGFMGEMFIELFAGSPGAPALAPGERLAGTDPIALMELVKRGTQLLDQFEKISASLKDITEDGQSLLNGNKTTLDSTFKNLDETSGNLKDMTSDLKSHPWKLLRKGD